MLVRGISRRALLGALPFAFVDHATPSVGGAAEYHGCAAAPHCQDVSPALVKAICSHCAAYSELRQIARQADAVVAGRPITRDEFDRLDSASDVEREFLLALCAYPAANDAERHDKATYLLGIFEGDEPDPELVKAILRSMSREADRTIDPAAQSALRGQHG
ncbi:hypothetical protein NKH64_30015 [Mesorhizobium sp. M0999]|uniref:hypothetical protein n=1 Tax=Mesorhizobium sp. M0999 TaxID=2957045 RepID=UPI003336D702